MPVAAKSYWPALAGFVAFAFSYTAVVARKEGSAVDAARARWYAQKERGLNALSAGQYQKTHA
ncbi:hypothetical protein BDV96DRAFT_641988 [Lophiotrema nucula]|uniref:Uncharacterized protein n=1 Tax=Lophiotrema nucula TaxID=690887 RepID=A0A6A5ZMT3_9PLEO|nr:hypothetical protein BDV96DRAFT_641988 [Lophiotrema nucula]